MRELKTLEVDKWEPGSRPGTEKHAGMISPQEAWDALKKHLEGAGLMPDEYFLPGRWVYDDKAQLPDYFRASCDVNWGGNEGIYLDIALLYWDENKQLQHFDFATGKTLGRSGDDFLRMSRIAAECSMMLNGRGDLVRFHEDEKGFIAPTKSEGTSLDSQIAAAQNIQCATIEDVARYVNSVQEKWTPAFKDKLGVSAEEILSNSSLLSRIASEKQRLEIECLERYKSDRSEIMEAALLNVCVAYKEFLRKERLANQRVAEWEALVGFIKKKDDSHER